MYDNARFFLIIGIDSSIIRTELAMMRKKTVDTNDSCGKPNLKGWLASLLSSKIKMYYRMLVNDLTYSIK
jgi:hypothetical protein